LYFIIFYSLFSFRFYYHSLTLYKTILSLPPGSSAGLLNLRFLPGGTPGEEREKLTMWEIL
jgi:hypothetical protein